MIQFDVEKMRSVYVYILKITSGYVYVTSHRNGETYAPKGSKPIEFNGHDVQRVPIDQTVYQLYRRYSLNTEFNNPRLAALNMYGDTIVSVEAQQWSRRLLGFQKAESWKSYYAKALADLRTSTNGKEAYIDGVDIFWPDEEKGISQLDSDGCFSLVHARAIRLGNLGRPLTSKESERIQNHMNSGNAEEVDEADAEDTRNPLEKLLDNNYHLSVRDGVLLRYRPEMGMDDHEGDYTTVYSSVLATMPSLFKKADQQTQEEKEGKRMIRALYEMCHDTAPSQANLTFLLSAAKTVGGEYGMENAHFLNVPAVMKATGQMSLVNIPEDARAMTPIGVSAQSALAWLFKFIYMEDNLKVLRSLSKCMKKCLRDGLMPQSAEAMIKPEARGKDLPSVGLKDFRERHRKAMESQEAIFGFAFGANEGLAAKIGSEFMNADAETTAESDAPAASGF